MMLETVVFTALPTSRNGSELRFSVLLSPQLGGQEGDPRRGPLSKYPDFAKGRWPSIVGAMQWQLALRWTVDDRDEQFFDARRVSADPDPALFALLFPDDMPVDPFTFDNPANAQLLSYPAAAVADALDQVQITLLRDAGEIRPVQESLVSTKSGGDRAPLDGFAITPARRVELDAAIDAQLGQQGVTSAPRGATSADRRQAVQMLRRMLAPTATEAQMAEALSWPDLDFHAAVSLLGAHPNLLRRLGLLVDLSANVSGLRRDTGDVRVYPATSWPPPYDPDVTGVDITTAFPRVMTTLGAKYFRPKPRGAQLTNAGFVSMDGVRAITSNVESEAIAHESQATGLVRMFSESRESFGTPERTGTPARHSGGIELVRTDHAKTLKEQWKRLTSMRDLLELTEDVDVAAEDLLAGHRLDVRRKGAGAWRSLHRRHGVLTPYLRREAQRAVDLGDDEGWVEIAGTSALDDMVDGRSRRMRIRESLAMWTGWSLSLPEPGRSLTPDNVAGDAPGAADAPDVIDSLHGAIDYSAPSSGALLPSLRFSDVPYEMRIRWVDLGGNSLAPDAAGGSIIEVPYLRHDPVSSPALYLAAPPVWGESVGVAVVRTGNQPSSRVFSTARYVAAPQVSAALCLAHGVFDDASGRPKSDAYAVIAARETATLPGELLESPPETVPYLPDPLGKGVLIRGVPTAGTVYDGEFSIPYGGSWPQRKLLTIELDGRRAAGISEVKGRLLVGLPAGRVAHLRLSNSLDADGLKVMDLWRRALAARVGREARALAGAYWQLTPDRVLVLVHASQRPIAAPRFPTGRDRRWTLNRPPGQSAVNLRGQVTVDQPSTESVDLIGTRTYAIDEGPGTAPPVVVVNADMGVLGNSAIPDPGPGGGSATIGVGVRAAFPDTRHEEITVSARGASRFAEYFRDSRVVTSSIDPVILAGGNPVVEGSVRATYASGTSTVTAPPSAYVLTPDTGTFVISDDAPEADRIPLGKDLTISFIPGPITRSSLDDTRGVNVDATRVRLDVPSSARPEPPRAEWILPAFAWESGGQATRTSTRTGRTLRLYLARPWFTSGIGERLAIVLRPANANGNAARDALVTQWGLDPITSGGNLPAGGFGGFPRRSDFVGGTSVTGVELAEFATRVDLVTYDVGAHNASGVVSGFDEDRDMYYVDITINTGSAYRPFVRLALARYQADSVGGLELSPVSIVDVVQLEPDRSATLRFSDAPKAPARQTASVTLTGRSYVANEAGPGPGTAILILERYDGPVPKGDVNRFDPQASAAWTEIARSTMRGQLSRGDTGMATWSGSVTVDKNRQGRYFRIVIEEYERIRTDGSPSATSANNRQQAVGERLVHQDIFRI
ncbi:MAG: hypothetical protein ACKOFP_10525 [Actinomycetota bacterium]